MSLQALRDDALYAYGYLSGKSFSLTGSAAQVYGTMISKMSSLIALPLPFLSFLALPFFGGTSTWISVGFFYLTWSTLVWSKDPLAIEIYGTLAVRLLFYLLPSLGFLACDALFPSIANSIKADGERASPLRFGRKKLSYVVGWSTFNVLLAVALQGGIELLFTHVLSLRSALRVSTLLPTPWSIFFSLLKAIIFRGLLHYPIHRYILHAPRSSGYHSPLATYHTSWAHSLRYPFSLAASYDHPLCYLLSRWLPLYLPALIFRFHVLTYHLLVALTSLEELFIYSGYSVLPSQILLSGMARRTETHYATGGKGNFGHWGVMDWVCGTSCKGDETDVLDDVREEADKRHVRRKVSDAVANGKGLVGDAKKRFGKKGDDEDEDEYAGRGAADDDEKAGEDEEPQSPNSSPRSKRRSKRKGRKASAAS
ncbi:hypothetical protein M8818_006801 [Zalaria obscura]|uniref:Uncharacterized protein n=1 Tax=Zalaria obscura TaxID=2024903 RepID=A0ACC3S4Y2_9PEZI